MKISEIKAKVNEILESKSAKKEDLTTTIKMQNAAIDKLMETLNSMKLTLDSYKQSNRKPLAIEGEFDAKVVNTHFETDESKGYKRYILVIKLEVTQDGPAKGNIGLFKIWIDPQNPRTLEMATDTAARFGLDIKKVLKNEESFIDKTGVINSRRNTVNGRSYLNIDSFNPERETVKGDEIVALFENVESNEEHEMLAAFTNVEELNF